MRDKGKVALARIVVAHREHVMAIQPFGKGLLGTTLRYPYEVREPRTYFSGIRGRKVPKDMVALASHILETKAGHFDPSKFKDQYETALKSLVRRKAKGKPIEPPQEKEAPSNVINLMDALRQSLRKGKSAKGRRSTPRKRASSRARKAA